MNTAINNNTVNRVNNLTGSRDQDFSLKGLEFYKANNLSAAWTAFNEAIRINPREWVYYYQRAACSACLGQYNVALADYNTALNLSKTNYDKGWCHFDMAIVYGIMGNGQKMEEHAKIAARFGNEKAQQALAAVGMTY